QEPFVEASAEDFNFDSHGEIRLASDKLVCFIAPATGGHLYELDVRSICHNLLATFTRRPEAYHQKVAAGANQNQGDCASIHDRVLFKHEKLDQRLQYDSYPRKSLVDHFYDSNVTSSVLARCEAAELGDFVTGLYGAKIRKNPGRIQILLHREGV